VAKTKLDLDRLASIIDRVDVAVVRERACGFSITPLQWTRCSEYSVLERQAPCQQALENFAFWTFSTFEQLFLLV
jgi:hypothetical protein